MFHTIDLAQATCTLRYNLGHMFVKTKARVHDDPQNLLQNETAESLYRVAELQNPPAHELTNHNNGVT